MNSIEDQCSGDSSCHYQRTNTNAEGLLIFHPEPGASLASAIGEQMPFIHSYERIHPILSVTSHTESNNDSERQSLNESENLKYKTELCRNFSIYGLCSYSSRCQFAHGLEELRDRTRHPKYKTELCRNFPSGYCKYGSRCQFLHHSDETMQSNDTSTVPYPTAVAAIGTYLLTNIFAQSAAFGLGDSIDHQSALTALVNFHSKTNSSRQRMSLPFNCGIEMQQLSHLPLSLDVFHGMSIPQNQNNNDHSLVNSYLDCQSQSCPNQTSETLSEDRPFENNNHHQRIRKSSAHM